MTSELTTPTHESLLLMARDIFADEGWEIITDPVNTWGIDPDNETRMLVVYHEDADDGLMIFVANRDMNGTNHQPDDDSGMVAMVEPSEAMFSLVLRGAIATYRESGRI